MDTIWNSIVHIYGYLAILPVIPFIIVFFAYKIYAKDTKKAVRLAMDVTTVFLIGIVAVLFDKQFGSSFGLYGILLVMVLGAGLLGNAQFRKRGVVDAKKIFRTIWRLGFFSMALVYILLMFIGLGQAFFKI
jgi:hypothetical protein